MTVTVDDPASRPLRSAPDPHGEAALLLVESLIHGLIATNTLTLREAIEIVTVADESRVEIAHDRGDHPAASVQSVALLSAIAESLSHDLAR